MARNDGIDRTSVRVCGRYALHGTPWYLARPALLPVMCTPSRCARVQGGTGGAYSRRPVSPATTEKIKKDPPHLRKTKPIWLCKSPKIPKNTKRSLSEPRLCYNQLKAIRQRKEESKMRKRIVVTVLMAALTCLLLMGAASPAKPLDLVGNWEEKDKGDSYQAGYIKEGKDGKDGEIVIYWVSDGGDTKSLYWAGTYVAPKDNKETYSWTSKNNKDKTDHALLASGDDTKVFTYEKGEITYKASALGTTKKMHFVRTDTNYCDEEEEQK
ncbi:hypothetical protein [Faecalibacterium sp. OM04-11BH]|uniref:hypothetical protein n=1 Tax=Faecalibacterium sp. OM04-11BH TaxID=2292357 RepID=UPI001FAA319B|nr:hypothetical protein [Faecalibacterium sp. OM04-11BH]